MSDSDLKKQQNAQKDIEFYAAAVAGWLNTRLERDKSLLALSAGGIGLLITLLTTVGVSSAEGLVLHLMAMFSFLACLVVVLIIFEKNSSHIEDALKLGAPPLDPLLTKLDNIAVAAFGLGIIFSSVIGISAAINSYSTNKEKIMANESKQKNLTTNSTYTADSVNGISNLKPSQESNKSSNERENPKPLSPQSSSNSTSGVTQPATPAAAPVANEK